MKLFKFLLCMSMAAHIHAQTGQVPVTSNGETISISTTAPPPSCFTDVLHQQQMQSNPLYNQRMQQMNDRILAMGTPIRGGVMVIPVVVHIIHNNGPENISDVQVQQGINHLNMAFSNSVNTNIQFCLAKQDANGNFTTGINRVVSTLTNMTSETEDLALKQLSHWDPTKYLNIWLVKEISSLSMGSSMAGYAYLPAAHGAPFDGIVNEAYFFGSSYDNSKVHVHEAGHYLGLYHTFEGGCTNANCQTDGDRVCDTPPDNSTSAVYCGSLANTCTSDADDLSANNPFRPVANGGLGDQPDMVENYMDYNYQFCQYRFTPLQSDRMNLALTTTRASLLQSMGCFNPCTSAINALFTSSDTTIFQGESVTFTVQNPSAATYTWKVNGVAAGTGNTFTYNTFTQTGNYVVSVTGSNGDPSCENAYSINISVKCQADASFTFNPGGPYPVNTTISAANTSQNATSYSWYFDGILHHSNSPFSQLFSTPSSHNLFLVASNGTCSDTSNTQFFTIGNCNISGMNSNWAFTNLSMNFTSGNITTGTSPITDGNQESTTTISDPNGNLLFFSDGLKVWDRNHNIMPHGTGLMGHVSSTQSCLATPFPGNPNLYYLFTNDAIENNFEAGLRYSIIDMTLNGGLGDVVSTSKNILIRNDVGEMLSGTFHANGHDIWISAAKKTGNTYYTFLLNEQGLNITPVISTIGTGNNSGLGSMKFSPAGNKMASITLGNPVWSIALADFNKSTGEFVNGQNIWLSTTINQQGKSFEFSPDNSKLYVNFWQIGQVWQYNLSAGSYNAIVASKTVLNPQPSQINYGQLCRANNGRIYMTSSFSGKMDYIANPNIAGTACNYTIGTINSTSLSMPNMLQGLGEAYVPSISGKSAVCVGEQVTYTVPYLTSDQSVAWNYVGSGTFVNNGNNSGTLSNLNGLGKLTITVTGNCGISHDTLQVHTVTAQQVHLGNDTTLCGDLYLHPQPIFTNYLWSTGSIATSIFATPPGAYWVQTKDINGCIDRDTIVLSATSLVTPVNLGNNTTICNGQSITLHAGNYNSYSWQDGSTNDTYIVTQPGIYSVTVSDGCGSDTDSLTVTLGSVNFNLTYNGKNVLCKSALPFMLTAPSGFSSYLWQNGSTANSINITTIGTYYVTITDGNGCSGTDTLYVVSCAGVDESDINAVNMYPNPANTYFTVEMKDNASALLFIYDAAGKLVFSENITQNATVDTQTYANGVYTAEVRSNNKVWRKKLIVVH